MELATAPEFVGLSPHQLVPKFADMSMFVASESSVYRVLLHRRLLRPRDRSAAGQRRQPVSRGTVSHAEVSAGLSRRASRPHRGCSAAGSLRLSAGTTTITSTAASASSR